MAGNRSRVRFLTQGLTVLLFGYWLAMFVGTHVPVPSGTLPGNTDKFIHFGGYAGLAFLLGGWLSFRRRLTLHRAVLTFFIVALYGVFDELTQPYFGRHADLYDVLADWAGAVFGLSALASLQSLGLWFPPRESNPADSDQTDAADSQES